MSESEKRNIPEGTPVYAREGGEFVVWVNGSGWIPLSECAMEHKPSPTPIVQRPRPVYIDTNGEFVVQHGTGVVPLSECVFPDRVEEGINLHERCGFGAESADKAAGETP